MSAKVWRTITDPIERLRARESSLVSHLIELDRKIAGISAARKDRAEALERIRKSLRTAIARARGSAGAVDHALAQ